jgi:hypothetical protein
MHPSKEMVFSEREFKIIFVMMTEEKQASRKDRKTKKKHMGEPNSVGLHIMVTMMSMFPLIVAM